jgi:hypothetical protein
VARKASQYGKVTSVLSRKPWPNISTTEGQNLVPIKTLLRTSKSEDACYAAQANLMFPKNSPSDIP